MIRLINLGTPTYNGRYVVVGTPTLTAFGNYMQSQSFSFNYDHAFAVFEYIS